MALGVEPIQFGLVVAIALALGYVWFLAGRGRWYSALSERLLFGVPWGSLVSIGAVLCFYLFAQSGLTHWESPVTLAFRNWSYSYPVGMLVSGFAHASPAHLTGNLIGTLVLAPIVEYAWSHYPPREPDVSYDYPPPGKIAEDAAPVGYEGGRYRDHPWVRALVVFPGAVFLVSILTSVLALGWSLGFSGTVFAFAGFAVVYLPLASILAMVAFTGTSVTLFALQTPILRATADPGAPGPPGWWAVNVQAHVLGFLIGAILAILLLKYRGQRRRPEWVFSAVLVVALTRQLYSFTASGGEDVYLQLRGVGLVFVLALTVLITAAAVADRGSDGTTPGLPGWVPGRRVRSVLWIVAVGVVGWAVWSSTFGDGNVTPLAFAFGPLLLILLVFPAFRVGSSTARRRMLLVALGIVVVVVALPSVVSNVPSMADDPVPEGETISIQDYEITYAEEADHGRIATTDSGVIVVSERRQIWSTVAEKGDLEHSGEATVPVGGVGWREEVTATRTGWAVTGGDAAYVVDLAHDGETRRAFASGRSEARARISGRTVAVEPDDDGFLLEVTRGNETAGTAPIPDENATATVGDFEFRTERVDGTLSVFVETDGTRVLIAEKEEYD